MHSIILFTENNGWHEEQLQQAFARYQIKPLIVSLRDCRLTPLGIEIPGMNGELPQAAMVRAVPGGSFEEVTHRLDILHALKRLGVLIYNEAHMIEQTVDKAMASFLLTNAGVATPATWVCESHATALTLVNTETTQGNKLVLKPLFGNCGKGLVLISTHNDLPDPEAVNGIYYLQRYIAQENQTGRDWRVLVINGQAVAAMERVSDHWITNRARGGKCLPAILTDKLRHLAEAATHATGAYYAGIDIIADAGMNYLVLEVNSVPAWRGLQSVCQEQIASLLVDDFINRVKQEVGGVVLKGA